MTPHLQYSQVRQGHDGNKGSSSGIIEMKDIYYFLDGVRILERTGALTEQDRIDPGHCDEVDVVIELVAAVTVGQSDPVVQHVVVEMAVQPHTDVADFLRAHGVAHRISVPAHSAAAPSVRPKLAMLLPTALPSASAGSPIHSARRLTASSGIEVAKATSTRPVVNGDRPKRRARPDAAFTSESPPSASSTMPATK